MLPPLLASRAQAVPESDKAKSSRFLGKLGGGAGGSAEGRKAEGGKEGAEEGEAEEEEAESWVGEKVEDAKEAMQALVAAVPGPRVGSTGAPWLLVLPAAYLGLTFLVAVFRTVQKYASPRAKRRRQVNKNAELLESIDSILNTSAAAEKGFAPSLSPLDFAAQQRKFGFSGMEVVRKYVRYALNEKPFTPELVGSLIAFRRASQLPDEDLVEALNDIAERTVKAKGRVMMDTSGMTEKGLQRKAAVQSFFSKLLYLSELDDFLSPSARDKLELKSIFGVTDEDVDKIRIVSLSSATDLEGLDKSLDSDDDSAQDKE